jgi:uncharacterized membrane protein
MWVNVACNWWCRIRQKYDLYSIVKIIVVKLYQSLYIIFTLVQLIKNIYRFVN